MEPVVSSKMSWCRWECDCGSRKVVRVVKRLWLRRVQRSIRPGKERMIVAASAIIDCGKFG